MLRTLTSMSTDNVRADSAAALRDLNHTFAAHDPDDDLLRDIARDARALVDATRRPPNAVTARRLMQAAIGDRRLPGDRSGIGILGSGGGRRVRTPPASTSRSRSNPMRSSPTSCCARRSKVRPARAHGGIVAAAFDDVTGFVIGQLREPAFTGELTVRYLAPVPVDEPLEMRARLESRERRKLFITAEARHGERRRGNVPGDLHHRRPDPVRGISRPTLTRAPARYACAASSANTGDTS